MVVWMLFAVPVIMVFGAMGLAVKYPSNLIIGKIIFEIKQYEKAVVYRLGKYHRTIEPGWRIVIPVIESFVKYDLRTEALDVAAQEVITKDGIKLLIDAIIYLRVEDAVKAELEVEEDYRKAIEAHVKGRIRNIAGTVDIAELYANIGDINKQLEKETQELVSSWGVDIVNMELQTIKPPDDVVDALQAKEIAERYKEAAKEEAQQTRIRIDAIEAAAGKLSEPALNYLYLQTLKDVADGQSSKIIFPLEFSKLAEKIGKGVGGGLDKEGLESLAKKYLGSAAN
ncbi:MAG: SPFH domain-containing protein [Candidatus Undinarchaeales archaeon]